MSDTRTASITFSPHCQLPGLVPLLRATANKRIFPFVRFFFSHSPSHSTSSSFHLWLSFFFFSLVRSERPIRSVATRHISFYIDPRKRPTLNDHRVLLRSPTATDDLFVCRDIHESGFFKMRMELTRYRDSSRLRLVGEIGEDEFFWYL